MVKNKYPQYDIRYFTREKWGKVYEEDKYWEQDILTDNFLVFVVYTFAWLGLPRPTTAQLYLAQWIYNTEHKYRLAMGMRAIAKSLVTEIYCVWSFLRDRNEKILIQSSSAKRAKNFAKFVRDLFGALPIAKSLLPRRGQRDAAQYFDVNGMSISEHPSMMSLSLGETLTGYRATKIIYDDIESPQTVQTMAAIERTDEFSKELLNFLVPQKGEVIGLGTPHSINSIYNLWLGRNFKGFCLPAEYAKKNHPFYNLIPEYYRHKAEANPELIGTAIDERINDMELEEKKLGLGLSTYRLQYLLDTSSADDIKHPLKLRDLIVTDIDFDNLPIKISHSSLPEKRLHIRHNGFNSDAIYLPSYESKERLQSQAKVMAIDPKGKGADKLGITIGGVLGRNVFLKEILGLKGGYEEDTFMTIIDLLITNEINIIYVEDNYGDGAFSKMLEPYLYKFYPKCKLLSCKVYTQKEVRIIEALEPLLNQHRIILNKAILDKDLEESTYFSFTYQLTHITRESGSLKHDDKVDSLYLFIKYCLENHLQSTEEGLEIAYRRREEDDIDSLYDHLENLGITNKRILTKPNFADSF